MHKEEPFGQRLRAVTLLDVEPGRAGHPITGDPIAIVTLACKSEVEQPLAISLPDARRLVVGLLAVLHTMTGEDLGNIVDQFFDGESVPLDDDPRIDARQVAQLTGRVSEPPAQPADTESTPIMITVRFPDHTIKPTKFSVIGGYMRDRTTMLLIRPSELTDQAYASLAKVTRGRIRFKGHSVNERISPKNWPRLMEPSKVSYVQIKGELWSRLGIPYLKAKFDGKTLMADG